METAGHRIAKNAKILAQKFASGHKTFLS